MIFKYWIIFMVNVVFDTKNDKDIGIYKCKFLNMNKKFDINKNIKIIYSF